jgi:hypothetical protein
MYMKRTLLFIVLVLGLFSLAVAQVTEKKTESKPKGEKVAATTPSNVEQELIKLDQEWGDAGLKGDSAVLERILADEFMSSEPTGVMNKAQSITQAKSDAANITNATYTADEYTIRMLDKDTAIMVHRAVEKGQNKGRDYADQHRSIHVWKKINDRWQVVASQAMPITQQPTP